MGATKAPFTPCFKTVHGAQGTIICCLEQTTICLCMKQMGVNICFESDATHAKTHVSTIEKSFHFKAELVS